MLHGDNIHGLKRDPKIETRKQESMRTRASKLHILFFSLLFQFSNVNTMSAYPQQR